MSKEAKEIAKEFEKDLKALLKKHKATIELENLPIKSIIAPCRKIAAERSTEFLKEAKRLSKQHLNDLAMYGKHYKNTLGHDATELRIKWLEFKATFLIETFRLSKKTINNVS